MTTKTTPTKPGSVNRIGEYAQKKCREIEAYAQQATQVYQASADQNSNVTKVGPAIDSYIEALLFYEQMLATSAKLYHLGTKEHEDAADQFETAAKRVFSRKTMRNFEMISATSGPSNRLVDQLDIEYPIGDNQTAFSVFNGSFLDWCLREYGPQIARRTIDDRDRCEDFTRVRYTNMEPVSIKGMYKIKKSWKITSWAYWIFAIFWILVGAGSAADGDYAGASDWWITFILLSVCAYVGYRWLLPAAYKFMTFAE